MKRKVLRTIAVFVAFNMLVESLFPLAAYALTSGPSQPEVQSFEPAETSQMVDLFSGDFNYNLPLLEVPGPNGGYPINLAYHSGVTMDEEASWVGLGWNINAGVINRQMRGLPDDFNGDIIKKEVDMKTNFTVGVSAGMGFEFLGAKVGELPPSYGSFSTGITIKYNNYRGLGYSIDPGLAVHQSSLNKAGLGMGFNFTFDSQEGVGFNPSLSLAAKGTTNEYGFSVGIGYNSRKGLENVYFSGSRDHAKIRCVNNKEKASKNTQKGQSAYSFFDGSNVPSSSIPFTGTNFSISYKYGPAAALGIPYEYYKGFFTAQWVNDNSIENGGYGYLYAQYANGNDDALMDFSREKDGVIRKENPYLPVPQMNFDVYSCVGQGLACMYRPFRSDIGILKDPTTESVTTGGGIGGEYGPGLTLTDYHWGINANINRSKDQSFNPLNGDEDYNDVKDKYGFISKTDGDLFEPYYYKTNGEITVENSDELNKIGGYKPQRFEITDTEIHDKLIDDDGTSRTISSLDRKRSTRKPRNQTVTPITNDELLGFPGGGNTTKNEILGEYDIGYFDLTGSSPSTITRASYSSLTNYDRSSNKTSHIAGITSLGADGKRYVYAIPAYNIKQVDCNFTVYPDQIGGNGQVIDYPASDPADHPDVAGTDLPDYTYGTEDYISRTTVPAFAHSYLLTAVLGDDYVDIDNIPGPSNGDLGYWVRFNYSKIYNDYKWRAPYQGASYSNGSNDRKSDNKASYLYGEKEVWHLASVETKTHIAIYELSKRNDAVGAKGEYARVSPADVGTQNLYKIDRILLYSKQELINNPSAPVPIKTVVFTYNYELCKNIPNYNTGADPGYIASNPYYSATANGKLTLKEVYFTYQNNTRGKLSPYVFNYGTGVDQNPDYKSYGSDDRWGTYNGKDATVDPYNMLQFPYADQSNSISADTRNKRASAWHLTEINLPTGGKINIQFEADDYAYVQNKPAMQMYKVSSLDAVASTSIISSGNSRKVYFDLDYPIPQTNSSIPGYDPQQEFIKRYIGDNTQIYFKISSKLMSFPSNYEYVSGYAAITASQSGLVLSSLSGGKYTKGYIQLNSVGDGSWHPFQYAAWQHIRNNVPQLLDPGTSAFDQFPGSDPATVGAYCLAFGSYALASDMLNLFKDYNQKAYLNNWGNLIDLNNSYIRLNTPDKVKYGGGARVRQISYDDGWNAMTTTSGQVAEPSSVYGQVYEYTTIENGETISSGVASYEPQTGGDENPFRRARDFTVDVKWDADMNYFVETPINESYFPGASVGYSKVTVKSLATHYAQNQPNDFSIPAGISSTGKVVYEYYTARDFPVLTNETNNISEDFNLWIPIPLIGQITVNDLTATQGYSVELNDMHGKPSKVSYYGQNESGNYIEDPVSWIQYNYRSTSRSYDGKTVKVLNNEVKSTDDPNDIKLVKAYSGSPATFYPVAQSYPTTSPALMGVDYEFFTDIRHTKTKSYEGGLDFNIDISAAFALPSIWPDFSYSSNELKSAVTNKIIHRSGILVSTEAYTGKSLVKTENRYFDAQTGEAVITTVTNDYNDPVYTFDQPAYWPYPDGMGPAYQNIGYTFKGTASAATGSTEGYQYTITPFNSGDIGKLAEGDEFVVSVVTQNGLVYNPTGLKAKMVYAPQMVVQMGIPPTWVKVDKFICETNPFAAGDKLSFLLVKSGRRNLLETHTQSLESLTDPTNVTAPTTTDWCASHYTIYLNSNTFASNLKKFLSGGSFPFVETTKYMLCQTSMPDHVLDPDPPPANTQISGLTVTSSTQGNTTYVKVNAIPFMGVCNDFTGSCAFGLPCGFTPKDEPLIIMIPFTSSSVNITDIAPDPATPGKYIVTYNGSLTTSFTLGGTTSIPFWYYQCSGFVTDSTYHVLPKVVNVKATKFTDAWTYIPQDFGVSTTPANSYLNGKKGVWRTAEEYYYLDKRTQNYVDNKVTSGYINLATDGIYSGTDNSNNFYWFNYAPTAAPGGCTGSLYPLHPNWNKNNTVTQVNPFGFEIENKDALDLYSSAMYGYNNSLAIAVGKNMQYAEMLYDGFEEKVNVSNSPTSPEDFATAPNPRCVPSTLVKHSGKTALKVKNAAPSGSPGYVTFNKQIILNPATPTQQRKYTVSGWVLQPIPLNAISPFPYRVDVFSYNAPYLTEAPALQVNLFTAGNALVGTPVKVYPSGKIIDGWQRIEGEIDLTSLPSVHHMTISLVAAEPITIQSDPGFPFALVSNRVTYFDDVRCFPSTGNMKSFVYDPNSLKLKATLDENNYSTFYQYDDEGNLYAVKQETTDGIKTVKEIRAHVKQKIN